MYLTFLFTVIFIAVAGIIAFTINDKRVKSDDSNETKANDFEIIE